MVFWKELIIGDSHPIPPYTHHLWMKNWPLVWLGDGSFHLSHDLLHYTLLYSVLNPLFNHSSQFVLKTKSFRYVSVENHACRNTVRQVFLSTYVELKYQNDYHNQAGAKDFQPSIWIFSGCWLSPAWYNTVLNLITIIFNWSTWTWSIIQRENLQCDTSQTFDTFSHSTFSTHCTNLCVSVAFLPFLK